MFLRYENNFVVIHFQLIDFGFSSPSSPELIGGSLHKFCTEKPGLCECGVPNMLRKCFQALQTQPYFTDMFEMHFNSCPTNCLTALGVYVKKINRKGDCDIDNPDETAVNIITKIVLRIISRSSEPLFLPRDYLSILEFHELETELERHKFAQRIFKNLPSIHRRTLIAFLTFLHGVGQRPDIFFNVVNVVDTVATTFAPYLVRPYNGFELSDASESKLFVIFCINNISVLSNACAGLD